MSKEHLLGINEILEMLIAAKRLCNAAALAGTTGSIKISDIKYITDLNRIFDVFKDPATNSDRIIPSSDELTKEEKSLIIDEVLDLVSSIRQLNQ